MIEMDVNVVEFSWRIITKTCVHYCRNFHGNLMGEKLD